MTVPYDPAFVREREALVVALLGGVARRADEARERKGYALVGGNRAGNNAFFVRRDVLGDVPEVSVASAYSASRFRESRGQDGELTYIGDHEERLRLLASMPLVDVDADREVTVAERFDLS